VLDSVLAYLICPVCAAPVRRAGNTIRCPAGHSFDVARQGYVALRSGRQAPGTGDTAAMVQARARFLRSGHYASLAAAIARLAAAACRSGPPGCVVDVGAGTGYYLAAVLDRLPGRAGVALDISSHALRLAARAHQRIGAVGCDAWRALPVADAAAALVLSVFAPRNPAQARRILHPDGRLLVVTPTGRHLAELVAPLGLLSVDPRKDERLGERLGSDFRLVQRRGHTAELALDRGCVADLAAMGPSAWHLDRAAAAAAIGALAEPVAATLDVTISLYQALPAAA